MKEIITLEVAHRLFEEAWTWTSGRTPYITMDSAIRQIAVRVFQKDHVSHLQHVCNEIFYALACEAKGVER